MTEQDAVGSNGLWAAADVLTPMAVRVAATLRIGDHLAGGPKGAGDLAMAAGADADALERLLRHLDGAGVVRRSAAGTYELTPLGDALRDDHPSGVRSTLDVEGALGRAELSFIHLLHSIRTGEAAFPVLYGQNFWDDLVVDQARADSFNEQMVAYAGAVAPDIAAAYDWASLNHVIDVGGGNGVTLIALLTAHPELRGTVFDLPSTVDSARRSLADAGLSERADVFGGSFFESVPPGAGGYLLSAVLHDWDDGSCRAILKRCAEAAGPDGAIFVIEWIGAEIASLRTELDLRMLAYNGSRERGVEEIGGLATSAGLRVNAVHPAGKLSIIELVPVERAAG